MKPKMILRSLLSAVLCWTVGAGASPARAEISVSEATRQEMILDYGKKVVAENAAPVHSAAAADPYAQEGQQMASQLQVISDNEDVNYTIVEGDTLAVTFKDRDQVSRAAYKVSQAGEIFMPLLGAVKLAGLNRKQARERVDMMLKDYIRDPRVSIAINADGRVMVFGAVEGPGIYNLSSKMTVMEAIFSAGGFIQRTAELGSVIVIRGPVEKPVILKLNLKKMIARGDRSDDVMVKPGDFVYVPTTLISNLDTFWNTMQGLLMKWYGLGGSQPIKARGTFAW
jgi:protein involved in polysaccharide export with SLBB domain